jgi:hypothetical protein
MKKIMFLVSSLVLSLATFACPMCEKQQPEILRGIVHGGTPDGKWDYVIVSTVAVITLITLFFAVKWIVKPGEKEKNHIKYSSLIFE